MPRYIVYVNTRQFFLCMALAEALDKRDAFGGWIYEPLGATVAEKVMAETKEATDEPGNL